MATIKNLNLKSILKDVPGDLLEPLTLQQKKLLIANIEIKQYNKHEIIYRQGDIPNDILCLIRGKVKVYKNGENGKEQILRLLKPIEFFAYRAYFANQRLGTSGCTIEPSVVVSIPMNVVVEIIEQNHKISIYFIKHLSSVLGVSDSKIVTSTQKHLRGRLAETILHLKKVYGSAKDCGKIDIRLTHSDLANISNMSTSNAIRTLSDFVEEGIISREDRRLKILDLERLNQISITS